MCPWQLIQYLTIKQAAMLVQSVPARSSGSVKGWQELKEKRTSVFSVPRLCPSTGLERSKKPSSSPIVLRLITPEPSCMMHLQSFTLKQPVFFSVGDGDSGGREKEEYMRLKQMDKGRKRVWNLMFTKGLSSVGHHRCICSVESLKLLSCNTTVPLTN